MTQKNSLRISRTELKQILLLCTVGSSSTLLLLNITYLYLPVGSATTIHFLYPIIVTVASAVIIRERPARSTVLILIVCTIGLSFLFESITPSQYPGIFFAALSSFTWSFQMLYLEHSKLASQMTPSVLAFYQNVVLAAVGLLAGGFGGHTFSYIPTLLPYLIFLAFIHSALATILIQKGIALAGVSVSAILSVFEPVSSILFGFILLREGLSIKQLTACIIILAAITVNIFMNAKAPAQDRIAQPKN
jgi:drug/metabolite transporter (DMT)-like permease